MKKQIGEVGVDSGQILVCDPCYIDSEWKKEEFNIPRRYRHNDGTILQYGKDFPHYESVIPKYGKTMNQINADHEAVELPDEEPSRFPFSYNACCKKTCNHSEDGQLNYEMGHPGVGVVTRSGYGDGCYPVYADYTKDGSVKSITIIFIEEDEE
jgi:hypothetical protein